ncbi:MAG: ACT domain-containing protein [Proteobacteria bacterium]|nr:ACT domain-containing protein [Pseudomonadota bacterium]
MKVIQISIFLENTGGRIAEATSILADAGINIRAMSLADTTDFGVLRLIVSDVDKAEKALKDQGFAVGKTNVVAVQVEDKPGGLNRILQVLAKAEINVEYIYAFLRDSDQAIMIFRFDNTDNALKILQENKIKVFKGEDIYAM